MQVIFVAVLVTAAFLALLWWKQENILFQPPPSADVPRELSRRIDYTAPDGQKLFGYLIRPEGGERGFLLAFHGNADLAAWQLDWAGQVARRVSFAVLLAEYRGYGGASGKPTYSNTAMDADAAYNALRNQLNVSPDRIAFFGHSLGSAVAAELAARHLPCALLLQSPFTSARDMARISAARPLTYLWRFASRIHFDTLRVVENLDCPVSVVHGSGDLIIPTRMGKAVFAAAHKKAELLIVDGAGHNNLVKLGGERYWSWLAVALK